MSVEKQLEDILIALLNKDATLAALSPQNHDSDTQNKETALVVSVVKESEVLEGPGGFRYTGAVILRSNDADASNLSDLAALVDAAIETPDTTGIDLTAFSYIAIEEETGGDRPTDENTRSRIRTFPIHAA